MPPKAHIHMLSVGQYLYILILLKHHYYYSMSSLFWSIKMKRFGCSAFVPSAAAVDLIEERILEPLFAGERRHGRGRRLHPRRRARQPARRRAAAGRPGRRGPRLLLLLLPHRAHGGAHGGAHARHRGPAGGHGGDGGVGRS